MTGKHRPIREMDGVRQKQCSGCLQFLPMEEFPSSPARPQQAQCQDCARTGRKARAQRYKETDPKRYARQSRDAMRRHKFGITPDQYEAMLERQGGVCAICGQPEVVRGRCREGVAALAVDHDRRCCPGAKSCGACIRGLLCFNCNTSVGKLEPYMERVVTYLEART